MEERRSSGNGAGKYRGWRLAVPDGQEGLSCAGEGKAVQGAGNRGGGGKGMRLMRRLGQLEMRSWVDWSADDWR